MKSDQYQWCVAQLQYWIAYQIYRQLAVYTPNVLCLFGATTIISDHKHPSFIVGESVCYFVLQLDTLLEHRAVL